ncbi:hypothetical protein [Asaia sp. VD9]|uniref:hypothetical protein n=1 Tax=Asaia sp. VD9 TaxID=3081235 RepID=UPI003016C45B
MTVYSFACSTPDNWSSWHMWAKTFGPGIVTACVTGSIASAAYIVARTQREIAANKYDLDLFDKRYPLFEKINEAAEKTESYDTRNECVYEDIKLADYSKEVNSRRKLYISHINKIRAFDTSSIEVIYDEINKSVRLYRNITPEMVDLLKKNIKEFNEIKNKKYELKGVEYEFCGNANNRLGEYIIFIAQNTIKVSRNLILTQYTDDIRQHEKQISVLENEEDQNSNYEFGERQKYIDFHRKNIDEIGKKLEEFIEKENYCLGLYDGLIFFISDAFSAANEIKSGINFIRDEMNRHLNVSEVSYRRKRTFYRTGL